LPDLPQISPKLRLISDNDLSKMSLYQAGFYSTEGISAPIFYKYAYGTDA
jgi:hypothetical protein